MPMVNRQHRSCSSRPEGRNLRTSDTKEVQKRPCTAYVADFIVTRLVLFINVQLYTTWPYFNQGNIYLVKDP